MLIAFLAVANAAPPVSVLPPEEERLELESLDDLRLDKEHRVPAWPIVRTQRPPDGALVGLAFAAVSGVLVAALIPDYVDYRRAYGDPCWGSLKQCI